MKKYFFTGLILLTSSLVVLFLTIPALTIISIINGEYNDGIIITLFIIGVFLYPYYILDTIFRIWHLYKKTKYKQSIMVSLLPYLILIILVLVLSLF